MHIHKDLKVAQAEILNWVVSKGMVLRLLTLIETTVA